MYKYNLIKCFILSKEVLNLILLYFKNLQNKINESIDKKIINKNKHYEAPCMFYLYSRPRTTLFLLLCYYTCNIIF